MSISRRIFLIACLFSASNSTLMCGDLPNPFPDGIGADGFGNLDTSDAVKAAAQLAANHERN